MSMLAEPRRRNRIGPNPRGKFFIEDEDNRGRNMLQKMGWKHGDGLGVERQGITEPIKPKIQTDAKGLGFDIKSDPWIAHSDNFNAILKNLQAAHGTLEPESKAGATELSATAGFGFSSSEVTVKTNKQHNDLEVKSRTSRSRIHYQKFIKNKDLSKIKKNDWSCIFGKPVDGSGNPIQTVKEVEVKEEIAEETSSSDPYSSGHFINRGSYQDYFKAQRAKAFVKSTLLEDQKPQDRVEISVILNKSVEVEDSVVAPSDLEQPKKRKKNKKSKKEKLDQEELSVFETEPVEQEVVPKKKHDKKKRRAEVNLENNNDNANEEVPISADFEETSEEPPKKKKKHRESKQEEDQPKKHKKNKKSKKEKLDDEDELPVFDSEPVQEEVVQKKKRDKKKRRAEVELDRDEKIEAVLTPDQFEEASEEPPKKKKKYRESKNEEEEKLNLVGSSVDFEEAVAAAEDESSEIIKPEGDFLNTKVNSNVPVEEITPVADIFKGSNLLQIPGYRNQSNKLL